MQMIECIVPHNCHESLTLADGLQYDECVYMQMIECLASHNNHGSLVLLDGSPLAEVATYDCRCKCKGDGHIRNEGDWLLRMHSHQCRHKLRVRDHCVFRLAKGFAFDV